ncbi:hypothetical protein G4B88_011361 [Cannabis sativa]|uniref:Uncharacterized protein n=1 Tax=Cannabis sativa TaxID=3483 RepID=A0A7J6GJS9_CANSA|nr:hypothetical protein G4B88_011361 [Cannabis sativa]
MGVGERAITGIGAGDSGIGVGGGKGESWYSERIGADLDPNLRLGPELGTQTKIQDPDLDPDRIQTELEP